MTKQADLQKWHEYNAWIESVQDVYPGRPITETLQGVNVELEDGSTLELEYGGD